MTQVEEIEIGSIGGSGGIQIGKLAVVTREVEVTPEGDEPLELGAKRTVVTREVEVTPEGDQPLELGAMVIAPAEIPFLGVAETVRTVSENVIVTSDDLVTVYKVLNTCIPVASLYAAFGETRTKTCIRILEKIGVVVDDGAGYKCNVAAVQQLVDGVSELCIK